MVGPALTDKLAPAKVPAGTVGDFPDEAVDGDVVIDNDVRIDCDTCDLVSDSLARV